MERLKYIEEFCHSECEKLYKNTKELKIKN